MTRLPAPNVQNGQRPNVKPVALATLSLLSLLSAAAWGQATAPSPSGAASAPGVKNDAQLEVVNVTAQRRLERLQDVPASVKAFTSKQIENIGIASTQDFINLTPNMSFDNSFTYGNSFVVLRGVTQINNADSPVAVVVDGVPQNNQKQLKMNLFDVERIEVLKGPQGALYGRNAIGGAINIETKAPTNKIEGFGALEFGNGGSKEVSASLSGAIVDDKVLFRVAGQAKKSDGLIENTFRAEKVDAIHHDDSLRAKLLLNLAPAWKVDLRASVNDFSAGGVWDAIVPDSNPGHVLAPRSNILGRTEGRTTDVSAKVTGDLSFGTFTSITAYTTLGEAYRGDLDFSNPSELPGGFFGLGFQAGQGQNLNVHLTSQELRLTSHDDQPVRWIGGVYYLDTRRSLETRGFIDTDSSVDQFNEPAKVIIDNNGHDHNTASAVFGQIDADFAGVYTLSGALRYDRDERKQNDVNSGASREATFSKWQPKVTMTRKFDRDTIAYGTVSTGFRSGGFNAPGIAEFRPETLTNGEVGAKTVTLGGRLLLNTAVFYSRSRNFQYFLVDAATGSQIINNIDRVDIKGLDLDFRFLPVRGLEFDGGLGVTDSKIKRNDSEPDSVGNHTPKTVPYKVNLGAQYVASVGNGLQGLARLDYEHRAKKYWHPDNAAVSPALDLIGARFALSGANDKWTVALFGRNLADKHYYADFNAKRYSGLPYDIGSEAPRRTFGVEVKVRL